MRAVRWHGHPNHVTVDTIPKATLFTSEDALIHLTSSAICGSELHVYHGIAGSREPPWTLGHEGVGIVQEVGDAVQIVKPGDRVVVPCIPGDGKLEINPIPSGKVWGYGPDQNGNTDGLQAEYIRVPQADANLIPIPHHPSRELDYLMISDIWATAWTCLDASGFKAGETVAVFGAGPVGLLCAYTALFRGASRVYVVDHVKLRLAKAKELGAIPIDFTKGNAAKQILKIEELGCVNEKLEPQHNAIVNDMIDVTIPGGGIGIIGVYMAESRAPGRPNADEISPTIEFPMTAFWKKSLSMKAAIGNPQLLALQLVKLIKSGRAHPGCVVSSVISIESAPEGYRRFNKHFETKVVIRFPWEEEDWHWKVGEW
ncbi:alcohol dehydrogenase GroES-like domain-containing protein [Setomelanomma holmii]|uniref:Alcohol dehydrogenase GroES-like domain-containing protein n=1 Tax=Setomelanomma holmii TaxID=210430 RepID=A0A9P4HJT8_9PLEO|nr:alcohol dehydrogenase GroES-like domain-containing protein [Setomelanomma holmii]